MTDEVNGVTEPVAEVQETSSPMSDKEQNFMALRTKAEALERQNHLMQSRLMEIERNQQKQQQPSYSDDDIPTWGDLQRVREDDASKITELKEELADIRMRSKHSDYEQTIKDYLPDVLTEEPDLALAIKDNPLMHKLAYRLAQGSPRYHQEKLAKANQATVDRIVENTTRPAPATSRKNVTMQDEDARISAMSDTDIMSMFNMAKARS